MVSNTTFSVTALCLPGFYRNNDSSPEACVACPIGFYQSENMTTVDNCTACPASSAGAEQTTNMNGSISKDDCKGMDFNSVCNATIDMRQSANVMPPLTCVSLLM